MSGPDHPGITASLMNIIDKAGEKVADIGQAVTHNLLSLSILLELRDGANAPVLKDLLFKTKQMGLSLDFQIVEERSPSAAPQDKFILNCVSQRDLSAHFLHELSSILAKNNVNIIRIDNLHPGRMHSLELTTTLPNEDQVKQIKLSLIEISDKHQVDMAFLKDNVFRRNKRLIVFDMDSTLIQAEVIDEMAKVLGKESMVKAITERAMNGEIDFKASLQERVGHLKGLTRLQMEQILENLPLTPGVVDFVQTVKTLGYKVALISGGFSYFADFLKLKLGLDYAFANELEMNGQELTGKIAGTIIDAEHKATLLKLIAQQEHINLEQVVAIGDGANDLPMLASAGLGIAFHAKKIVRERAQHHMSHGPMTSILYFLGIPGVNSLGQGLPK